MGRPKGKKAQDDEIRSSLTLKSSKAAGGKNVHQTAGRHTKANPCLFSDERTCDVLDRELGSMTIYTQLPPTRKRRRE